MRHKTTWNDIEGLDALPRLNKNVVCDVCVVGGGIAGTTAAYLLAKAGKNVVVLEQHSLATSVTAYTTAFITSVIDTNFSDVERMFGRSGVRQVVQSSEDAIDMIEQIVKREHIDCEFMRVEHYSIARSEKGLKAFREDQELLQSLGYGARMVPPDHLPFANKGAMEMQRQAKFHPLKYLLALRRKAMELGASWHEHTEAVRMDGGAFGEGVTIRTNTEHVIRCDQVVVATYNPFEQPWWYIFKKGMYYSDILELSIPKGILPEMIAEDDENPYNYFRVDRGEEKDRLIVGGADHRKQIPIPEPKAFGNIESFAREILGGAPYEIVRKWRGPILEQTDGLPLIGRYSRRYPNRFVATGFSGNGMTYGTLSGMIITDLITGKDNPYEMLYRPYRPLSGTDVFIKGRDYLEEMVRGIYQNLTARKTSSD